MSIKSISQNVISRSSLLFTLRQHVAMIPALLAGPGKGASRTWSQHGEDTILVEKLKPYILSGFYVDIGANHPTKLSNTYRLYCMGMRGISIEPNDIFYRMHKRYRPGDIALCAAIGPEPGLSKFHEMSYHAFSTFSEQEYQQLIEQGVKLVREAYKPIFPLSMILEQCRPSGREVFALLSVDTEGWDEFVLRSNDWERFRPCLVVVEQNSLERVAAIDSFLTGVGYSHIDSYGCNCLFTDNRLSIR